MVHFTFFGFEILNPRTSFGLAISFPIFWGEHLLEGTGHTSTPGSWLADFDPFYLFLLLDYRYDNDW